MVYQYKWRATHYKVSAQEAGEYLHEMSERENGITPKMVLDVSRDEDALLHPCFEWDDAKAAEAHRINQARRLIGNLVCTVVTTDKGNEVEEPQVVRAFVNTADESHAEVGRFKPIVTALTDDRMNVLNNAKKDAEHFKAKYSGLVEFSIVIDAIDKVLQETA